jgi:hypothetical protein
MSEVHEVIIYSNPGEKMLWDSILNGTFFPTFLWFAGGMLSFFVLYYAIKNINRRSEEAAPLIAGIASFIVGLVCAYKFA